MDVMDMDSQNTSYSIRIGNTTFVVSVKQSETAKKPIDTVFRDLCVHEVKKGLFVTEQLNLEKLQEIS